MVAEPQRKIKIVYCYDQIDSDFQKDLDKHLSSLRSLNRITTWFDNKIQPGSDWKHEIETQFSEADIILLLVSADFMASKLLQLSEMQRAFERHNAGTAHVIPIILRPVDWEETIIGTLQALPTNGKPITQWDDRDQAFVDVVRGIRVVINKLIPKQILSTHETSILYPELIDQQRPHSTVLPLPHPSTTSPPVVVQRTTHASPPGTLLYTIYPSSLPGKRVVTWFSDSNRLATISSDGTLQTWDAITGQLLMNYPLPYQHLMLVAWSPDSNRVAIVSSSDRKTIQVWDTRGQRLLTAYPNPKGVVDTVAWSPDSMHIASSTSQFLGWTSQTTVWRADTGQALSALSHLRSSYPYDIAWSPKNVHIGSNEGVTIRIWDAETGKIILKSPFSESKVEDPPWFLEVRDFAWSPDGTCIAMTMLYRRKRKEFTRFAFKQWERTTSPITYKEYRRAIGRWDLPSTYRTIHQDKVEQNPPKVQVWTALSWSPDGTRIAVAGSEGIIQVRDANTGFLFLTCDVGVSVTAILWSPDGTRIAVQLKKSVQVWQVM